MSEPLFDMQPHTPLIAIIRGVEQDNFVAVAEVLVEAGFSLIDVPLNSPDVLTSILDGGLPEKINDKKSFVKGVVDSQNNSLTNQLIHTHSSLNQATSSLVADYLSGLLIGHELCKSSVEQVDLVGGTSLCQRYLLASETLIKQLGHNIK